MPGGSEREPIVGRDARSSSAPGVWSEAPVNARKSHRAATTLLEGKMPTRQRLAVFVDGLGLADRP
jgi:hypothetical protein